MKNMAVAEALKAKLGGDIPLKRKLAKEAADAVSGQEKKRSKKEPAAHKTTPKSKKKKNILTKIHTTMVEEDFV